MKQVFMEIKTMIYGIQETDCKFLDMKKVFSYSPRFFLSEVNHSDIGSGDHLNADFGRI